MRWLVGLCAAVCLLLSQLPRAEAASARFTSASEGQRAEGLLQGAADPEAGLPPEVLEQLGPYSAAEPGDLPGGLWDLVRKALSGTEVLGLRDAVRDLGLLLAAGLLSSLLQTHAGGFSEAAPCLAVAGICAGGLRSALGLGTRTVEEIHSYLRLLLPGLGTLMAASGRLTGAGAVTAAAMLGFDLLAALLSGLVVPVIGFRAALAAAESIAGLENLEKLRSFLKWAVNGLLKGVFWLFTGLLTMTDLFTGSADARQLRMMRTAISGMIPVLGGMVSDASESLLSAAALLKASTGIYGVFAVFALCLTPFLRIWLRYLALKTAAALSGLFGKGRAADLMEQLAGVLGSLLAAVGIACILALLSLTLCMKTVTG